MSQEHEHKIGAKSGLTSQASLELKGRYPNKETYRVRRRAVTRNIVEFSKEERILGKRDIIVPRSCSLPSRRLITGE